MEHKETPTSIENLEPNVAAAFAYLIPPFTGIVFFLIEKKNNFVRFHALQSILAGVGGMAILKVISILNLVYIGYILSQIVWLVLFFAWLVLMWKAYQNIEFELPVVGQVAKDIIKKQQ